MKYSKQKKYTYDDWLNGKICLIYSDLTYKEEDKPIKVGWDRIVEKDIPKIQTKQKELFNEQKNILLETWKDVFSKGYENSEMKQEYLMSEIQWCESVLLGKIHKDGDELLQSNIVQGRNYFEYSDLYAIRKHIGTGIK